MNVNSVGNAYSNLQTQATQRTPEATEIKKAGRDNDGDSDDGAKAVRAPAPSVNLNGQKLGQIVNVSA